MIYKMFYCGGLEKEFSDKDKCIRQITKLVNEYYDYNSYDEECAFNDCTLSFKEYINAIIKERTIELNGGLTEIGSYTFVKES